MLPETNVVNISLTKNEALVFFDFVSRFNQANHQEIFEDQSEERVLLDIEAQLETILTEPLLPNYLELITAARNIVKDKV